MKLVDSLVMGSGLHAAAALARAADQIATDLANLGDPTLALRSDDVRSLGRRAAAHAAGGRAALAGGARIAKTLRPADVAELNPAAVALGRGRAAPHAGIVSAPRGSPRGGCPARACLAAPVR